MIGKKCPGTLMKRSYFSSSLFLAVSALLIFLADEALLQQQGRVSNGSSLSGQITLPASGKRRKASRGRAYRNRQSQRRKQNDTNRQKALSPFYDVIISAHPLSFRPSVRPMSGVKVFQRDATFLPRVTPLTPGSSVQFINSDKFFHNVFSITPGMRFNIGRRPTGTVVRRNFDKPGEVKIFCDIHAHMNAFVICLETPYFIRANKSGYYQLDGLPEGDYEIRVYHPDFADISVRITLGKNEALRRNFNLSR